LSEADWSVDDEPKAGLSPEELAAELADLDEVMQAEEERSRKFNQRALALLDPNAPKLLSPAKLAALVIQPPDPLFSLTSDTSQTVFAERDYGMIHARRGTGKTMWSLGFALALAAGARFLHLRPLAARRVLYVDGEMPLADMKVRLASILRDSARFRDAELKAVEENFRILSWETQEEGIPSLACGRDDEKSLGQDFIDRAIAAHDPAVVILDNISALAGSAVENDESEWKRVGDWAKAHRRERSIIWIHHSSRMGTARGTSKREDPMDFVLHLRQPKGYEAKDGACFELIWEKARGRTGTPVETRTFKLNNDETDRGLICTWGEISQEETTSKAIDLKSQRLGPIAEAVMKAHPGISKRDFRRECRELYKEQYNEGIGQSALDRAYSYSRPSAMWEEAA
jgi:hypothetical protein